MTHKIFSFIFFIISLLLAIHYYLELSYMGFPDGHLSELQHTLKKLYPFYIGISGLFSSCFLFLGIKASKPKRLCYVSFLLFIFCSFALNYYWGSQLSHGVGG